MYQDENGKIGWTTAAALVIANMVGTGVFTSLGFQLADVQNTWGILLLWALGGLISLIGAFSYAELGTHLPKSGGEYHFLSELYHPFLGYLSGWVSLTVGFAAPIALAAMALGAYSNTFLSVSPAWIAIAVIVLISVIHSTNIRQSSRFQNIFTVLKILLIIFLIGASLFLPAPENALDWSGAWKQEIWMPAYAVALVFVTYSYSGCNAAAYIVEEIRNPVKHLPRALIGGTLLVSILYILLNLGFLHQAPIDQLIGKVEVGQVAAENMFGHTGGQWISGLISLLLVSSISAMVWVGPRVTRAMANRYQIWHFLGKDNPQGIPISAIWFQTAISVVLILTGSFEEVLLYSGFILQVFTTLTVGGVILLRIKKIGQGYKAPLYPILQIIYLTFSFWILTFLFIDKPMESLLGMLNLVLGGITFWVNYRFFSNMRS
jgi:APA family basic amino acid/polyamine antiporter